MTGSLRSIGEVDRLLHEPSRLVIAAILSTVEEADFLYLLNETGLTRGNLSVHLTRLEEAGHITIEKTYRGKLPRTVCRQTPEGRAAFDAYRRQLKDIVDRIS